MARKGWDSLSAAYRGRLERAGISQSEYEGGRSLQAARGHGATPENPRNYDPKKYARYHGERTKLERELFKRKERLFEDSSRWNAKKAHDNVREYPPSLAMVRWALNADDEDILDALRESPQEYAWLGYH